MKRWLVLLIGALMLFGIHRDHNQTQAEKASKPNTIKAKAKVIDRLTTFVPRKFPPRPPVVRPNRFPANIGQRKSPQRNISVTLGENPIRIGKSFKVVDGVATLEKEKYKNNLGKKIGENSQYVFFKPVSPTTEAWPVALNSTNLKLYPISHILHVKGVDADLRAQFKAEGMQEYYYHSRLKFISLETSPSTVMKQYQALSARGFDVTLEVLKETPQSK